MWSPSNMPGHFAEDRTRAMLLPPEQFAAPPESLSEKMFIERSLTENKFWLRIMKEHALFLGDGMNRNDKDLIQQTERFYHYFKQQEKGRIKPQNQLQQLENLMRIVSSWCMDLEISKEIFSFLL
jgi:hypothetical protein